MRKIIALAPWFGSNRTLAANVFYDHPLIRGLYPETEWQWNRLTGGRTQTNATAPEVLLCRG